MRFAIPILVVLGLFVLLAIGLNHDPSEIPSPLIGKPAPAFALGTLEGQPYTEADLKGRPVLVNFWASWCAACKVEHPLLLRLAREQGVEIIGMAYKDTPEAAAQVLQRSGNPYRTVVQDPQGSAGLDWGVYGAPETYVLDAEGIIRFKQVGPVTEQVWREKIAPLLGKGS